MVSRGERRGIGIRTWLVIVGFLLILPPGLPVALSTETPLLYGFIAVCFALVAGSLVWLITYQSCKTMGRSGGGSDRRDGSAAS